MLEKIRKTGIDVIGDIPWGTHLCQFYSDKKDLIDILVPYFKAGLKNNEFCIWVTSEPLGEKRAKEVMRKAMPDFNRYLRGQIEIVSYTKWYLKDGGFNSKRVVNALTNKLDQALVKDYDGLRVTGNISWLEKRGWRNFAEYEAEADSIIGKSRMIAICTYPLDKYGAFEILDVARNHQFALIKHRGEWELIKSSERARVSTTAIIDAMGDGLVLLDMDGKITSVNLAFEKMTCYKKSEVVGKDAADVAQKLIKTEDLENAMEGLKTALEGKVTASGVLTLISKDGREIPITFSASVAKDTEGKPTTLIYNIKDIAEFKRAEERELKAQKQRVEELEKFAKVAVGRELKMIELKQRIKALESKLKEKSKNG